MALWLELKISDIVQRPDYTSVTIRAYKLDPTGGGKYTDLMGASRTMPRRQFVAERTFSRDRAMTLAQIKAAIDAVLDQANDSDRLGFSVADRIYAFTTRQQ